MTERVPILLFEEWAHLEFGHHPIWMADMAQALAADGYDVRVLTRYGWLLDRDGRGVRGASATYRMARRHVLAGRLAHEFGRMSKRALGEVWSRPLAYLGDAGRQVALVVALRHCLGRFEGGERALTVVMSPVAPIECVLFAPRRARWILYKHHPPRTVDRAVRGRVLPRLAAWRERRRRGAGGFVRLVANNESVGAAWRSAVPWTPCPVVPGAAASVAAPVSRREARRILGLPDDGVTALLFGLAHAGKDHDTVYHAFAGSDAPARLVVAGSGNAERFAAFRRANPELSFPDVTIIDGYMSVDQRHLLHCAADYAITSFSSEWVADSGTLTDAVVHDLPVCCSATGDVGRWVADYGLGLVFPPGDVDGLRDAARRIVEFQPDTAGQAAYRAAFSPSTLARRLLAAAA